MNEKEKIKFLKIRDKGFWSYYLKQYVFGIAAGIAVGRLIWNALVEKMQAYDIVTDLFVYWLMSSMILIIFASLSYNGILKKLEQEGI